jgi:signal transduction histidine kinase
MDADFAEERATLTERQRIMSDIHDNVGSQLVGVLSLIRSGAAYMQLETQTATALQSLRIAVDAIQPVNGNLAAVLATLRHRLQPSLSAAGIALVWRVDDLPRMQELTPQKIQHIQRIVMEAFSNAIQYSKATKMTVTAKWLEAHSLIEICLSDDGVGMSSDTGRGQGLSNMAFRAEALGGTICMENVSATDQAPQGFVVTLEIPCLPA